MKTDSSHQPYLEPVYRLFIKVLIPAHFSAGGLQRTSMCLRVQCGPS